MRQEHCLMETLYVTKQQPLQKSFLFSLFHLQDLLFTMASKHMMGIDNPVQRVGFNVNIFINSQEVYKFICTICKNVLRNAVQIPESNDPKRACLDCYKDNIKYVSSFLTIFVFFHGCISKPLTVILQNFVQHMISFLKLCPPFYTILCKKLLEEATLMKQNVAQ